MGSLKSTCSNAAELLQGTLEDTKLTEQHRVGSGSRCNKDKLSWKASNRKSAYFGQTCSKAESVITVSFFCQRSISIHCMPHVAADLTNMVPVPIVAGSGSRTSKIFMLLRMCVSVY